MNYITIMILISIVTIVGCTVSHRAMRGSVVAVIDGETQICIGENDGLKVGDLLAVYRTRQVGVSRLPYSPFWSKGEIERSYSYEKVRVGTVRVTRLFDTHYAAVELISGEIAAPDIVEKTLIPED